MKIAIIDYGVGNLHSIVKAVKKFTDNVILTEDPDEVKSANGVILPGVGAFSAGMQGLQIRGLLETVQKAVQKQIPVLGICLGAQLMMAESFELGHFQGLNIIPGKVVKFANLGKGVKIPHIGWNKIYQPAERAWQNTVLQNIPENSDMYFIHSYLLEPENKEDILALTEYGGKTFCSAIKKGPAIGLQFHPEKSGSLGLRIIENFIQQI